tara:strand:- start:1077 stop:1259 length:183 start_codon:yes stop_codon:yes gene_type:complete
MNKKGELTLRFIILMILAVMVLIVVAIIFQDQIANFLETVKGTSSGLGEQIGNASQGLSQ